MAQGIVTIPGQIALLKEGVTGPTWSGAKLALFADNQPWAITDVLGTHTESSFPGYARQSLPWGSVFFDGATPAGADLVGSAIQQWQGPAGGTGGQVITGWGIVQGSESGSVPGSSGAPLLLAGGLLDVPVGLNGPADALPVSVHLDGQFQSAAVTVS